MLNIVLLSASLALFLQCSRIVLIFTLYSCASSIGILSREECWISLLPFVLLPVASVVFLHCFGRCWISLYCSVLLSLSWASFSGDARFGLYCAVSLALFFPWYSRMALGCSLPGIRFWWTMLPKTATISSETWFQFQTEVGSLAFYFQTGQRLWS